MCLKGREERLVNTERRIYTDQEDELRKKKVEANQVGGNDRLWDG